MKDNIVIVESQRSYERSVLQKIFSADREKEQLEIQRTETEKALEEMYRALDCADTEAKMSRAELDLYYRGIERRKNNAN